MSLANTLFLFLLVRLCMGLGFMGIPLLLLGFIAMLYFGQESMLYVPSIGGAARATAPGAGRDVST